MTGEHERMEHWGEELRRARLAAGMQYVRHLADASGVHKQTIFELESGKRKPRQDTLAALRSVLPGLCLPLEVSAVGDPRDPNGFVVHLPMDPSARARMLADLLRETLAEQSRDT